MNVIDVSQQWQLADQAAASAEAAMATESLLASEGRGDPPSEAQARDARRLRAAANALFELKMALVGDLIDSTVYGCSVVEVPV